MLHCVDCGRKINEGIKCDECASAPMTKAIGTPPSFYIPPQKILKRYLPNGREHPGFCHKCGGGLVLNKDDFPVCSSRKCRPA